MVATLIEILGTFINVSAKSLVIKFITFRTSGASNPINCVNTKCIPTVIVIGFTLIAIYAFIAIDIQLKTRVTHDWNTVGRMRLA